MPNLSMNCSTIITCSFSGHPSFQHPPFHINSGVTDRGQYPLPALYPKLAVCQIGHGIDTNLEMMNLPRSKGLKYPMVLVVSLHQGTHCALRTVHIDLLSNWSAMTQTDSITKPIEHKQRWHNSDTYILPTDDEESARLQLQHDLIRELFDGQLVICPLELRNGDEVLDVGTGKAAWALDFFATYSNASESDTKLVCIDISDRLFPKSPPSNMIFQIHNVLDLPPDWTGRFAFVNQRLLMGALKQEEWYRAVKEVYRVTKDGGWVQFCESNAVSHMDGCGPASERFMKLYRNIEAAVGLDFSCSLNIGPIMRQVGFVNVKTEHRVVQLGEWNGEVGTKHTKNVMAVSRGLKTSVLKLGGLGIIRDEEDFDTLMDEMEEEWKRPGSANGFYVITGQKPPH
ncbi:hypothetical protein D9619_008340 [Psilocybe cf. subviscida]|uniref:Methyltransferase domain-containing protein n=1 Tax=Psilocybe cf. subviscida TaxID=2480587 RepID=A0A8H5B9S2_9AGAR|nr:hypothetical protein D9619_008340 [Psilocybe cf. subviscida]